GSISLDAGRQGCWRSGEEATTSDSTKANRTAALSALPTMWGDAQLREGSPRFAVLHHPEPTRSLP
ncbi:hypothetical protein, partial [Mesorhizobium sp.]|uniref:hypothetical protein n=1 Tax=Mesorhizobium sp. TaxID=1871066 RepID=UPI0025F165E7